MKKLEFLIAMALTSATAVQAGVLASWDMTGLTNNLAVAPVTTEGVGISSSDLTVGPRFDTVAAGWVDAVATKAESWRMGPAIENSISLGSYYSFTLTPGAGKLVNYSNITARLVVNTGGGPVDVTFHLLASQTGFSGGDVLDSVNIVDAVANYTPTIHAATFDLASAGLTNLSEATEFRIYVSVATGGNRVGIGHTWSGVSEPDDLVVNGTIEDGGPAIPVVDLAVWDLDALAANSSSAAVNETASGITASDLQINPTATHLLGNGGWPNALASNPGYLPPALGAAISDGDYFGFTVAPSTGSRVGFDKISARFSVNQANLTEAIVHFHLLSDRTGFVAENELGSFTVTNNSSAWVAAHYAHTFDLSSIGALQAVTNATEFRIYTTWEVGNRVGIGGAQSEDGLDDLVVRGTLESYSYVPAAIVGWEFVSDSVMKLVVDVPSVADIYYPKGTTDLMFDFTSVAHSDTNTGPFVVTNLAYSASDGSNHVIYVEATDTQKFFKIGEQ